jgi:hypothetical protein
VAPHERSLDRRTTLSKKDSITTENLFLSLTPRQEIELQFLASRGRVDTRRIEGRWDIECSGLPSGAKRELKLAFRNPFCRIRKSYSFTCSPGIQPATRQMRFQAYPVSLDKTPSGKWLGEAERLRRGTVRADSEDGAWNMLIDRLMASIRDDVRLGLRVTQYAMYVTDPISKPELPKIRAARNRLHDALRLIRARKQGACPHVNKVARASDGSPEPNRVSIESPMRKRSSPKLHGRRTTQ